MKKTILIIDGKKDLTETIARILELAGYTVLLENNGVEGLSTIRQVPVDLILCSVKLPNLDGMGIKRALHNLSELNIIPFIFITEKYDRFVFRQAMDLGGDDFLARPFTEDELLKSVSVQLNKQELLKSALCGGTFDTGKEENRPKSLQDVYSLLPQRTLKRMKKKEVIYREDESAHNLYLLLSGKVKAFKTNDLGKDYITDIYRKEDLFGYDCLFENKRHHESAMTMEDSELAIIPKHEFHDLLSSNRDLALKFMSHISGSLSFAEEKLLKLAYNSARKRVAEALLFIYDKYRVDDQDFTFNINREDISALSGLTVESVSRNLTCFRHEGLIETINGTIRLLGIQKLQNLKN